MTPYVVHKYICCSSTAMQYINIRVFLFTCSNVQDEECLPDIMWCREPFMEEMTEIEALNDIRN